MILCMQENPFKYISLVCLYTHTVIWKEILLTVIASSKHTKLQFVLHSIQGYEENKPDLITSAQNPQRLLITLQNKLELPALLGRKVLWI